MVICPSPNTLRHMNPRTRLLITAAGGFYATVVRRRVMTWGATAEEANAQLPGDELLAAADLISTRAVTIDAPPNAVWPWIAQMGPAPRGGAYTYDWIENLLGLDMHSAGRVLPGFQHPQVGDTIRLAANQMRVERVDPERCLAWRSGDGNWVWSFVLRPVGQRTRLISRNRFRIPSLVTRLGMVPMEPGSLVMERKMLLGIKQRAETLAETPRDVRCAQNPTPPIREAHMNNNPKPTPGRTGPKMHHGTFAEGESDPKSFPEDDHVGTFAEGELKPDVYPENDHAGTFADGECDRQKYPEDGHFGTFEGEART
jgi:hypothetical protein